MDVKFKHATKEDIEPCDWHLRVRVTYEDYVTVKAEDYHEACKLAERNVFDNMNDGVESLPISNSGTQFTATPEPGKPYGPRL